MASSSGSIDYTDFRKKGDSPVRLVQDGHRRWWVADPRKDTEQQERDAAHAIQDTVTFLQLRQSDRMRRLVASARQYGNATLWGVGGLSLGAMLDRPGSLRTPVTDNVSRSVVDTMCSRVAENKPRPYHLTDGGNFKEQRKAKKLNQFTDGLFYEGKAYELGGDAQRDCGIFGDGTIHVFKRFDRVGLERVLSAELWVDEVEAVYGRPRQMHWVRGVDREELLEWVSAGKDGAERRRALIAVKDADKAPLKDFGPAAQMADMVVIRESWHLRSGPDAKDGKHCISIDGHLLDPLTEWEHDFFPFARFTWAPRPMGYWCEGLVEQLWSKQREINKILWLVQRSFHMAGTYKVFVEDGSKITSASINNDVGTIVKYRGTRPEWFVPAVVPMEYYEHYKGLKLSCYEEVGIDLQSAMGQKPPGLNSEPGQRMYRDTVNQRLKPYERRNETGFMDLAKICVAMAREIAQEKGHYEVKTPSGRILKTIRMTAEDLDPSGFEQQCFPTSSLPKDPSGRLATTQEFVQAGFLTPRQARRLMDFPDLQAEESLGNAGEDLLCMVLDAICDDGEYQPPEPTDDLAMAKEMVVEYIQRGRAQGLEEDRMELLRTYSIQVDALMQAAMPPPLPGMLPPGGPPGAGPQAVPMPPPQSALLPNVPM